MSEQIRAVAPERHRALEDVRRRNLADILGIVHRSGRSTRAELTRATGLNRSTIAAIVGELVRRRLVVEQAPEERGGVGRPSFVVVPDPATIAIVVHPEVDAVVIAFVSLGGDVQRRFRFAQQRPPSPAEVVDLVAGIVEGVAAERESGALRVLGVGAAVPGLVRSDRGFVELAPALDWHGVEFARMLEAATGLPAFAANDANCGVLAEHRTAAGTGDFVYLNGGASGIGGGLVVGGRLLGGRSGFAGELGHVLVDPAGPRCRCGSTGCLQAIVELGALRTAAGLDVDGADELLDALVAAIEQPGPAADVVDRQLVALGAALRDAVNVVNPEVIVLGGFLGDLLEATGDRLIEIVRRTALPGAASDVSIVRAESGAGNLLVGAAELVFSGILADPTTAPAAA
ncbi:ROK family transcriptional regulator [Agromyces seonyuensis]|uniref:ROK family protein n=1 Tax=Agromyces seonyuensis TaxID=2662446 RepID=A0A6I4P4U6_9MICO|nr:ROK family transcriptional regulator [Agromyces seonyuensis]MWB99965.1 ROK family protein [Agromyces seonyuensis]